MNLIIVGEYYNLRPVMVGILFLSIISAIFLKERNPGTKIIYYINNSSTRLAQQYITMAISVKIIKYWGKIISYDIGKSTSKGVFVTCFYRKIYGSSSRFIEKVQQVFLKFNNYKNLQESPRGNQKITLFLL